MNDRFLRASRAFASVLGCTIIIIAARAADEPEKAPKIRFASREVDFGQAIQGQKVQKTFTFTNGGNAPLVLTRVEPSCGCTVGRVSQDVVEPGKSGEIAIVFDSSDRAGYQNLRITVYSNDVSQDDRGKGATNLTLRGEVKTLYRVMPTGVYYGTFVRTAGAKTLEVRIAGIEDAAKFSITKITPPADWVKVEAVPLEPTLLPEGTTQGIKLNVTLLPHAPLGSLDPLATLITVDTDVARQPRIRIPVVALVADGVRGPDYVQMGRVERSQGKEQLHSIERVDGKVGLKVLGLEYDRARLEVEQIRVIEGTRIDLRIVVKKDAPPGPFAGVLRARLDDAETPLVQFPVFGDVVPRVQPDPALALARAPIAQGAVVARVALSVDAPAAALKAAKIEGTDALAVTLDRDAKPRPVCVVTAARAIDGPLEATLAIETSIAGEEKVLVPLRVEGK